MSARVMSKLKKFSESFQQFLLNNLELSDVERTELCWRRFGYYTFVIFVIVIGFPVWYFTTTPYRASLPYFDSEFHNQLKDFLGKPLSLQTGDDAARSDVWSQMTIFPSYNVHLVFVHEADHQFESLEESQRAGSEARRIIHGIRKFVSLFNETVQLNLSVEHFFDFSVEDFIINQQGKERQNQAEYLQLDDDSSGEKKPLIIDRSKIPALTTEIDRLSTQPVGSEALVNIAVFDLDRVHFLDNEEEVKGLAVASWGGFVTNGNNLKDTLNAVFAILKIQLGIDATEKMPESKFDSVFSKAALLDKEPVNKVLEGLYKHKLRLTAENLLQTVHFINSLHGLKDKIEDLVISDEVAQLAYTAYQNFHISYNALIREKRIDVRSSTNARILAEKAVTHYSLLEFLNFPSDQKYGIYVPLFFPLLFPLIQPPLLLLYFLFKRKKAVQPFDDGQVPVEDEQPSAEVVEESREQQQNNQTS